MPPCVRTAVSSDWQISSLERPSLSGMWVIGRVRGRLRFQRRDLSAAPLIVPATITARITSICLRVGIPVQGRRSLRFGGLRGLADQPGQALERERMALDPEPGDDAGRRRRDVGTV